MPPRPTLRSALLALVAAHLPALALAQPPLDLDDPRPRSVAVRFEVSPRDQPAQRDAHWTEPLPARLEPDAPGRVRVVVPAALVEERLLADQGVVPGSFDDFVWVFDTTSGEVVSATMQGRLERALGVGFLRLRTGIDLEVALSTREPVSFREGREVLGELVHEPCEGDEDGDGDCRRIAPEPYDADTGAVYAVGLVHARSGPFGSRSLCPLGEAIFLEASDLPARERAGMLPAVAAGPPPLPGGGSEAAQ
jgi:hypothetical protein